MPLRCAEGEGLRPQAEDALLKAAEEGDLTTLKRLLEEGVHVNATTPETGSRTGLMQAGYTALMVAASKREFSKGNLDCVKHLVAKGANLEATCVVSAAPPAAPQPPPPYLRP